MAVFARFMGWLAVAVGIVAAMLPFVLENALQASDAILIAFVGIFAGAGLVVLAQVLTVAEKIEEHTNWFSSSARPAAPQAVADDGGLAENGAAGRDDRGMEAVAAKPADVPDEHRPGGVGERHAEERALPQDTEVGRREPVEQAEPATPAEPTPVAATSGDAEPEVYDAARHPPAIEEWAYEDLRVMTLQDGSVAVELDGVWYRFVNVEDMVAYLSPATGQNS